MNDLNMDAAALSNNHHASRFHRWCEPLREGRGAFLLYVALITHFWWPALAHGRQMIFGDAAHHGLSLLAFLHEGLRGKRDLLWESGIYGGHPLFAESQGGFVNPVNLLCALLFTPEYGIGVLHWLNMLIAGSGLYVLCRLLQLSRWCSTFACITAAYSSIWLSFQYNISVTGAMAWLPWLLAATEYWLNRPTPRRAALMAIPAALTVFGGYPHIAYGAALYLGVYCTGLTLTADGRALITRYNWQLLRGGLLAVALAVALSAIQLLPLIELVGYSHRTEGVGIPFGGIVSATSYLRGLLFFDWSIPHPLISFGSLSSIAACLLAAAALALRPPARALAHALAALFLFNLGIEYASPLFRVLYDHHLLPGLHGFRIMHPFLVPAVAGFSLLAGFGLHALAQRPMRWWPPLLAATLIAIVSIALHDPALGPTNFIAPLLIITATIALTLKKRCAWIPLVATLAIATDAALLRSRIYDFYDSSVLERPTLVDKVLEDSNIGSFRAADRVNPLLGVFKLSNDPIHELAYRQILDSISPFPSLRWGISSINGVLALQLGRRGMIETQLGDEIEGISSLSAGRRLIDLLGIKYISFAKPLATTAFAPLANNPQTSVFIHRNDAALPTLRTYTQTIAVASPEEALQRIRNGEGDRLLIEGRVPVDPACSGTPASIQPQLIRSTLYVIDMQGDCPSWLFVADAHYPGWRAYIDGESVELYPANILGKAVHVPPGKHQVEVRFIPRSFYIGCFISAAALIALLAIALRRKPHE